MQRFTQHPYAPHCVATHNLTTGVELANDSQFTRMDSGQFRGIAGKKPYPLDSRGCWVRREPDGQITITLGADLTDYYRGTPAEIAALLRDVAAKIRPEKMADTIRPNVGQSYADWLATGTTNAERQRRQYENAAAIIEQA